MIKILYYLMIVVTVLWVISSIVLILLLWALGEEWVNPEYMRIYQSSYTLIFVMILSIHAIRNQRKKSKDISETSE